MTGNSFERHFRIRNDLAEPLLFTAQKLLELGTRPGSRLVGAVAFEFGAQLGVGQKAGVPARKNSLRNRLKLADGLKIRPFRVPCIVLR